MLHRRLLLAIGLLLLDAACGPPLHREPIAKPTASDAAGMNGAEARAVLAKMFRKYEKENFSRIVISPVGLDVGSGEKTRHYPFAEMPDPEVRDFADKGSRRGLYVQYSTTTSNFKWFPGHFILENATRKIDPELEADARAMARAFYVLKHGVSPEAWAATVAEVRAGKRSVDDLPEEARRFKVQADAAMRDRKLADAALRYQDVVAVAPWWAAGHFNLGLILGELGYYPDACVELSRYLDLLPDASDARQAKDKIYEWEAKK